MKFDKARAREVCEKASPRMNEVRPEFYSQVGYDLEGWAARGPIHKQTPREDEHLRAARADSEFMVGARELLPKALDEIERLRAALEKSLAVMQEYDIDLRSCDEFREIQAALKGETVK